MKNTIITIGEFSRLSRLSKKALRIYDKAGILNPVFIDPSSGYRYYAPIQVIESERIRALRSFDMSLKDIEHFLREKNPDILGSKLRDFRGKLERKISVMRRYMDLLDHLTSEKEEFFLNYTVMLKESEKQWIVSTRMMTSLERIGEDMGKGFNELCSYMESKNIPVDGVGIALYHCEEFDPQKIDVEIAMTVEHEYPAGDGYTCRELPACTLASTLHLGQYEGIQAAYGAVYNWAGENGYEKAGPDREIYYNCPESVDKLEDLKTEIALPVVKK